MKVLNTYYENDFATVNKGIEELKHILLHYGEWGKLIERRQLSIKPPEGMDFETDIENIIWQQKGMVSAIEDWKIVGNN